MKRIAALALLVGLLLGPQMPASPAIYLTSLPDPSTLIVIPAMVGDRPIRLTVDTGATLSALRANVWRALGSPGRLVHTYDRVPTASGALTNVPLYEVDMSLGSCDLERVLFLVVAMPGKGGDGAVSGLMGLELMARLGAHVDAAARAITTDCG